MEKIKNYTISTVIGYILIFIMFLITSCIFAYTNIDDKYLSVAIYISLFLSCMIASFILGKNIKSKGVIIGAIFGIIFYGLVFICSLVLSGFSFSLSTIIYFGISILAGIIGSSLGVNI